jgi:hypothetical protein
MHSRRFQILLLPHLGFAHARGGRLGGGTLSILTVCFLAAFLPAAAEAQQPPPPQAAGGQMRIEPMENGFVIAPDFKVTEIANTTQGLAGAYGGYLMDNTFLVGAAAYWLPNGRNGMDMWYGGGIVGWQVRADEPFGFSVRTLIGGGQASTPFDGPIIFGPGFDHGHVTPYHGDGRGHFHVDEDFFTLEPQADVLIRLARHVRIQAGAGYRAVAGTSNDSRLRGVTGSLAVQFSTADR